MVATLPDIAILPSLDAQELRALWRKFYRAEPPTRLSRDLLSRGVAYKIQEHALGGLTQSTKRKLRIVANKLKAQGNVAMEPGLNLKPGVKLIREWRGRTYTVIVLEDGFEYAGHRYRSLTKVARKITGAHWSGPRFFGLKPTVASTDRTQDNNG